MIYLCIFLFYTKEQSGTWARAKAKTNLKAVFSKRRDLFFACGPHKKLVFLQVSASVDSAPETVYKVWSRAHRFSLFIYTNS